MSSTDTAPSSGFGRFIASQSKAILFLTFCLCVAGVFSARTMPSSVFPQTNFPRVVLLIDNGVMPADQMMATITRPVEEAMKDIPGVVSIRTGTGRGSAEVNVFFDWSVDMKQSELYVLGRLAQIRATLPATATANVYRLTFSAFPILGVSLTSTTNRSQTELWAGPLHRETPAHPREGRSPRRHCWWPRARIPRSRRPGSPRRLQALAR